MVRYHILRSTKYLVLMNSLMYELEEQQNIFEQTLIIIRGKHLSHPTYYISMLLSNGVCVLFEESDGGKHLRRVEKRHKVCRAQGV